MTAKEQRYVRKLEIRINELEATLKKAQGTWVDQFHALFETRTAMFQAFAAIEEAAVIMHECMKQDPQYMAERKRIEIVADF